jgi:glycosyltransferase involved in cell wall biosynthesis
MKEKPKLFYVTDYYPYVGGYGRRTYYHIQMLSKTFKVYLFYLYEKEEVPKIKLGEQVTCIRLETKGKRIGSEALKKNILSNIKLIDSDFIMNFLKGVPLIYCSSIKEKSKKELEKYYSKLKPEVIIAKRVIGAELVSNIQLENKILDMTDSLALFYSSMIKSKEIPISKKMIAMFDHFIAKNYEKNIREKFKLITYISKQDLEYCGKIGNELILPDLYEKTENDKSLKKENDLITIGVWDYYPNLLSLNYIIEKILPEIKRKIKFVAVGPINNETKNEIKRKIIKLNLNHDIEIKGYVEDADREIKKARIMLAPVEIGSGIQNKAIIGLKLGLPIVCSPLIKNSIDPDDKIESIIVAHNEKQYAERIERLLENEAKLKRFRKISVEAYNQYAKYTTQQNKKFINFIRKLIK